MAKSAAAVKAKPETHTPGPWVTDPAFDYQAVLGADGAQVADCSITGFRVKRNDAINQANASLIATAPELLDLAKLLERSLVYQISVSKKEGDGEGARMKTLTLNLVRSVLEKAGAL